jgi:aryl-alcohol dehydrogenase-like predicted oxidoreductase
MEYRIVGNSGLRVSEIGLGGNNFGGRLAEAESISVIRQAMDLGINFIDTADRYSQGHSEESIGKAVKGKRSNVIIATKFGFWGETDPLKITRGSRSYIMKAVEGSLQRLDTDYIDLYYFHKPDAVTPIEETIRAMDDLVRAGKVRYIACSNFAAWGLSEALWTSRSLNLHHFIAEQSRYNLLDRSIEKEVVPCCLAHGVSVIPWGPLASGFLTGKYRRGEPIPAGTRFTMEALTGPAAIFGDVLNDANFDKLAKLEAFAAKRNHTVSEAAIAWLLSRPWVSSVIAGAMSVKQLTANIAGASWKLTPGEVAELDRLTGMPLSPMW